MAFQLHLPLICVQIYSKLNKMVIILTIDLALQFNIYNS